ncbi:MAG: hypothetical protein JRN66_08635 [Nitrososphaerota archaeon]|nr:hypothetical protein [Nitrososphaerota archaeon]
MRYPRQPAISEIIAILLVITITLVAAGALYLVVFGNIGRLSNSSSAQIDVNLLMTTSTTANAAVNIYNAGVTPISAVSIPSGPSGCTWSSLSLPIAPGATSTETATGCTSTVGTPQTWVFIVTFSNGQVTYTVPVTPHD